VRHGRPELCGQNHVAVHSTESPLAEPPNQLSRRQVRDSTDRSTQTRGTQRAESSKGAWRGSWSISWSIFLSPSLSDPVPLCLAGALRVRRFVPESLKLLVSSESDLILACNPLYGWKVRAPPVLSVRR